ncbi:aldo/keto reductase [Acidiferrimicrobium sp. IK]|uniref:aldo/keto reductase n=1 Tax=Acidiferrimicrobium sp. IK TaxID=2871700 RepID=UPI0021CB8056|nr:aldo/keto reductase [Acidiferrimicrobium sp. IK]MCU4185245.1 aldo/keto reductase [Acidiferrimicrobium sp. IK]
MKEPASRPHPGALGCLAGRPVARIGFGAMQLDSGPGDEGVALLRAAVDLGVDHLDTAEFYGAGAVNRLIRSALQPFPEQLVVVTKVGAAPDPAGAVGLRAAQRPSELRAQVEANLASLGVERLDVVNLRRMDTRPGLLAEGDQRVPLEDQLAELSALREEGKLAAIGLSHVSAEQVRVALAAGIVCVQNAYSVVDRSSDEVLETCVQHELAFVPYFPLGGAFPGRPKVVEHPDVVAAALRLGVSPAQVGLAWLLGRAANTLLIPGTRRIVHLRENLAAGDIVLDGDPMSALNRR